MRLGKRFNNNHYFWNCPSKHIIYYSKIWQELFFKLADRILKTFIKIFRGVDKYLYWSAPDWRMCSNWKLSNQLGFGLGNICGNVLDIGQQTVNDNQVNRFHFQLSRWDTKYKERSHILSEYLLLDNVKLIPSGLLKDFEYEISISSSPQAKPSPPRPSLQHKTDIQHRGSFNTIRDVRFEFHYLTLPVPACPSVPPVSPQSVCSRKHVFMAVAGGDCGESNTGHRQRGNQPHGTHIPVVQQLTNQWSYIPCLPVLYSHNQVSISAALPS